MDRRTLLAGIGLVGLAAHHQAAAQIQRDNLVILFLRGGADGLSLAAPYTSTEYYAARPGLSVAPPGETGGGFDLDGQFALNPALAALYPLYNSGEMAIVHAAGLPHGSRSHFVAQDNLESGHLHGGSLTGWLGRHMNSLSDNPSPMRSICMSKGLPLILRGDNSAVVLPKPDAHQWLHQMPGNYTSLLESLQLGSSASTAITLAETLDSVAPWNIPSSISYPSSSLGRSLAFAAQYIKAGVGNEAIHIDVGDWDTHDAQDTRLPEMLTDLGNSLATFHSDLGAAMQQTTVIVMTEFGRRVGQNANNGTDHGRGACMLALSGSINGGRVYADWPGLEDDNLVDGDLAITTDHRQVLWECLQHRRAANDPSLIFPDFQPSTDTGLFNPA